SVDFHHGRINALIGPNGSGKTTFFNCVTGMIRADAGRVTYRGQNITGKAPHRVAHAGIGRSFQVCRIFPRMSVLDNVLAGVRPRSLGGLLGSGRRGGDAREGRALLTRVGTHHVERAQAAGVSEGEQKLLERAGVLMTDPETIMLDEPAGGVNPALIDRISTLIVEVNAEGRTFIVV